MAIKEHPNFGQVYKQKKHTKLSSFFFCQDELQPEIESRPSEQNRTKCEEVSNEPEIGENTTGNVYKNVKM